MVVTLRTSFLWFELYEISGYSNAISVNSVRDIENGDVYNDSNNNENMNYQHLHDLPQPPLDNNQVAAWYDTDL